MSDKAPKILIEAVRQYKHNDGSEGFVIGYDEDVTNRIVEQLQKENAELRKELVAAVELMEGFNKAVAEWNNHDQ